MGDTKTPGVPSLELLTGQRIKNSRKYSDKRIKNKMALTESKFTRCYINGKKCAVSELSDGRAVLYNSLMSYRDDALKSDMADAGISFKSFANVYPLLSADSAGICAVFGGNTTIDWEGTSEYNARVAAAVSRPGRSKSVKSEPSGAEPSTVQPSGVAVASEDVFTVPAVDSVPALFDVLRLLPPACFEDIKTWGAGVGAAVLAGDETPAVPDSLAPFMTMPTLPPSLDAYRLTIETAAKEHTAKIEEQKRAKAAAAAAAQAAAQAAANGKQLITLWDGSTVEVTGQTHPQFTEVLEDVMATRAVYLYGPSGTGKSYMARQIAEALGLPFYQDGKSDTKYDLIGSPTAGGEWLYTAFLQAFQHGGVWLWDELDRSASDAGTAINNAIANGCIFIPGVGMIEKHADFYMIGAGNTLGRASAKYTGAQDQDCAVMSRFLSKIKIDYCREIDEIVTGGDTELCDFTGALRQALKDCYNDSIDVAIRLLMPMKQKAERHGKRAALETCLLAGVDDLTLKQIASRLNCNNEWGQALKDWAAEIA